MSGPRSSAREVARAAVCVAILTVYAGVSLGAKSDAPPHTAKPLLLDLLETARGEWRHLAWLGQQMTLDGPVTGLFAFPRSMRDLDALRLAALLTPSTEPDAWDRASLRWIEPDADGRYRLGDGDRWQAVVSLVPLRPDLVRAELTDLRCNQAFLSSVCLAGLMLEGPDGDRAPFVLMPLGPNPTYRLETDSVGHLAVGKDRLTVRVHGYNPLGTPSDGILRLVLVEKLTAKRAAAVDVALTLPPGGWAAQEIIAPPPRFGVFDAHLVAGAAEADEERPLASLRLTRVPDPRDDIAPDASSFGINVFQHQLWWYTFQPRLLRAMGAKWVRPWLAWENTWRMQEPEPGRYDFAHLDNAVSRLDALGLAYECILFSSPECVGGQGLLQTPPPPDKLHLWEDWVRALATHFKGRIRHYEAWNEPDMMWPGTAGEHADEYVPLLEATRRAARSADPDCVIDAPSSAGYRRWLVDATQLGARALTDVFTFHVYSDPSVFTHHARMRLDLWGGAQGWDRPVWLNEFGATACDLNPDYNAQVDSSELKQALTLVGDSTLFLAEHPDGKAFWFCSLDPHDPFNRPEWTPQNEYPGDAAVGLLYEGLTPKLGFAAFAALAREVDGRRALGQWSPMPGLHVVAFEGRRAVAFHDSLAAAPPASATELGCGSDERITVLDVCGNELRRGRAADTSLDWSQGPLYIRGSARLGRLGAAWGALALLRPPGVLDPSDRSDRTALLPTGAVVTCEVLQDGPVLDARMTDEDGAAELSVRAASGVDHALAFVRLRLCAEDSVLGEVFPVTVGALSLFDMPGFTRNPERLCTRERAGGIDWSATEGRLAPGCLVLTSPYDGRMANWQQWYLGFQPEKPLQWSVWAKAEGFGGADCLIALAQFGKDGWLGDRVLVDGAHCPTGDSEWIRFAGQVEPAAYPEGTASLALYLDVSPRHDERPVGRLLVDELDVWQPER